MLILYADGENFTTCLDANERLLCDTYHQGEVKIDCGSAFHEHNGMGKNNTR